MQYGAYTFSLQLKDDAILPPFKGSTFRGVLGHALKRVVCPLKRQACSSCMLRYNCTYAMAFETRHAVTLPPDARISHAPHPMIVEPPLTDQTLFRQGDMLQCRLILMGHVNRNLPYFIHAFDQMGRLGIGKKQNGRRSRFDLIEVMWNHRRVYDTETQRINPPDELPRLDLSEVLRCENTSAAKSVDGTTTTLESDLTTLTVTFMTPARINREERRPVAPHFQDLLRAVIRRSTSLINTYGEGEPELDYPGLIRDAADVRVVDSRVRWHDWQRYSGRQNRKMYMGGLLGTVVYEGRIGPFLPFLKMAEMVHIGKNTQFGLGLISVSTDIKLPHL